MNIEREKKLNKQKNRDGTGLSPSPKFGPGL